MMTVATFCYFALYQEACDMRFCYGMGDLLQRSGLLGGFLLLLLIVLY